MAAGALDFIRREESRGSGRRKGSGLLILNLFLHQ